MELIDLSQPLDETTPGSPSYPMPKVEPFAGKEDNRRWHVEMVTLPSHCGTHIDAPMHKLKHWKGLADFPLDAFTGKAVVADFRDCDGKEQFGPEELRAALPRRIKDRVVLLATGWGYKRHDLEAWNDEVPHLSPDGANWLVDKEIRAVGIDHWTVGGPTEPDDSLSHSILMADNIWIIENMLFPERLFEIRQPIEFWCLPVNMPKLTGALCRPVAVVRARKTLSGKP